VEGEHRVINHATETRITVLEIARLVQRVGAERGLDVQVDFGHDPRHERGQTSCAGPATNLRLRESGISTIPLEQGVRYLMNDLEGHTDGLGAAELVAEVDFQTGVTRKEPVLA